jgi:hypothetical protein
MSLTLYMECDVTGCNAKVAAEGAEPDPIVTGDAIDEFWIDQVFGLPEGWTYTNDLSYRENLHLCPEHTEHGSGMTSSFFAPGVYITYIIEHSGVVSQFESSCGVPFM